MTNYHGPAGYGWQNILANSLENIAGTTNPTLDQVMQRAQYNASNQASLVNNIFGSVLYAWYNQEEKFYGALPKIDMMQAPPHNAGDRIPKSFRVAHSPVSLDTHSAGGSVSSAANFTVEEVSFEVKRSETVISVSDLQQIESMLEDAAGFDELWEIQQDQLTLAVDSELGSAVNTTDSNYGSRDKIVKLDRAIASKDEEDSSDDTDDNAYSNGDLDYGTIDRGSDAWADSYVDHNGTSGDRQLTRDLMDDFLANLADNGDGDPWENGVIFTGRDTAKILQDLMADSTRGTRITVDASDMGRDSINDAVTELGLAGTTRFRDYDGIPVIANQNAPADTISRIFVLNLGMTTTPTGEQVPRCGIEQYAEPYTEAAGRGQSQGYLALGNYEEKALFLLNHEFISYDNPSHGKLRDLSD